MKKLITLILVMIIGQHLWAYDFASSGIYYNVTSSSSPYKVEVTWSMTSKYKGVVTVPSTVRFAGIDYSVSAIGEDAFSFGNTLTSVSLPTSIKSIGKRAFQSCYGLTSVNIPDSVKSISDSVFIGCSKLQAFTIPALIETLGVSVLSGCNNITTIEVSPKNQNFQYIQGVLYDVKMSTAVYCLRSMFGSINMPDWITRIGDGVFSGCFKITTIHLSTRLKSIGSWAFSFCNGLTTINIPDSVVSIESSAFQSCEFLTSITMPCFVTSIANQTFDGCYALKSISIPNTVTQIGEYAFSWCSGLTSITIPVSVTSIASHAFSECTNLSEMYVNASKPIDISNSLYVFSNVPVSTCKLHVPKGTKAAYQTANQWMDFVNVVEDITELKTFSGEKLLLEKINGELVIKNLQPNEIVQVFDMNGQCIHSEKNHQTSTHLSFPANRIYIIRVGDKQVKYFN